MDEPRLYGANVGNNNYVYNNLTGDQPVAHIITTIYVDHPWCIIFTGCALV